MSDLFSIAHLILLSPFLLALAVRCGAPKMLCLAGRIPALLLSVEHAVMLDWIVGTAVAGLPIAEKIRQCRLALSASLRRSRDRPDSGGAEFILRL
jgi:hypothetical protein